MERKTKIHAEDGKQELWIDREFELPVQSLFRAYVEADLLEQWMGTKVLRLDDRAPGGYRFQTTDPMGNDHYFKGCIHEIKPNEMISRTFEMENTGFPVQLELLEFEALSSAKSRLRMQVIYQSVEVRDNILKLPFAQGINMAHDRLQKVVDKMK